MQIIDLFPEFRAIVDESRDAVAYKARLWSWLDGQQRGPLGPLLRDMARLWSGMGAVLPFAEARDIVHRLADTDYRARAERVVARYASVTGHQPDCTIVLLAALRRPEGYSRFSRGRNTIFIGLDHPQSLRWDDHFEVILSHELTHAVRDPHGTVQADYGGFATMNHDEFVTRYTFQEHLVSESLATAISELCYPGLAEHRYIFFDEPDHAWCDQHRQVISGRMQRALDEREDYHTFYSVGSVVEGSPDCCDYYFALHWGRFALARSSAHDLLVTPGSAYTASYLQPFRACFVGDGPCEPAVAVEAAASPQPPGIDRALDPQLLSYASRRFYRLLDERILEEPQAARASATILEERAEAEHLRYGDRAYDLSIFPLVLGDEDERYLRWVSERVFAIFERAIELYRTDGSVRAYIGFPPFLEQLILHEPGFRPHATMARFDSHWNGKRVRFLELNANGTAGFTLTDRLARIAAETPLLAPLILSMGARPFDVQRRLLTAIVDAYAQWSASRGVARPLERIAIVDFRGLPTSSEHEHVRAAFAANGVEAIVADPSELLVERGRLHAAGVPVDLVYRRVTLLDVLEHPERLEVLFEACLRDIAPIVGSFGADVAHSKTLFAFLTHERWRRFFSMEERALIDAHLPWTRRFRPGRTLFGGELHDLRELALRERDRFVLKPAESFEGRGVVLGIECTAAQWEAEVQRRYGGSDLIQEYVPPPVRTVLMPHEDRIETVALHFHLGEYILGGEMAGVLARVSPERVLSLSSTDRVVPSYALAPAEEGPGSDMP